MKSSHQKIDLPSVPLIKVVAEKHKPKAFGKNRHEALRKVIVLELLKVSCITLPSETRLSLGGLVPDFPGISVWLLSTSK